MLINLHSHLEGRVRPATAAALAQRAGVTLQPPPPGVFDTFDPDNVAPLICWLALADCPATGQVFQAYGNRVGVIAPSALVVDIRAEGRWAR